MAYQLNKDTKILLVLLAVVVLCSAKLFKDYLYRNRYVEGMTLVSQESTVQLRRPDTGSETSDIIFTVSLGAELLTTGTKLSITWVGDAAIANNVEFPAAAGSYIATAGTITDGYTFTPDIFPSGTKSATFTPNKTIPRGTKVKITIKGVKIFSIVKDSSDDITFTIASAGTGETKSNVVKILPKVSGASTYTATGGSSSVADIKDAITKINQRINAITADSTVAASASGIAEINTLEQVRSAMISLLASTYGTIKEAGQVFESGALYEAQRTAINFIKNEKARAASNATALTEDNSNKRRMAQINTYYTRNYEANTDVMKNVIYVSIALIILAVLRKKELIPGSISTLGVIFILTMGGIVIGKQVFDIMRRNDSDFDKYDWNFNEDQLNQQKLIQQNSDPASLSDMGIGGAQCYGASCCAIGTSWDTTLGRCVTTTRITGTADWSNSLLKIKIKTGVRLFKSDTDTITVNLPPGLFSRADSNTAPSASGTSLTDTVATLQDQTFVIPLHSTANNIAPGEIEITISGLALNSGAKDASSKVITAFTSKEPNRSPLQSITGV
jgi:hypothetical protein